MASNDGQMLTDDEVREMSAYHAAGLPMPEKFASVVQDSSAPQGVVYRYTTDAERKAADDAGKAAQAGADANAALMEKVRAEAAKRGEFAHPAPPDPPAPPAPAEKRG